MFFLQINHKVYYNKNQSYKQDKLYIMAKMEQIEKYQIFIIKIYRNFKKILVIFKKNLKKKNFSK